MAKAKTGNYILTPEQMKAINIRLDWLDQMQEFEGIPEAPEIAEAWHTAKLLTNAYRDGTLPRVKSIKKAKEAETITVKSCRAAVSFISFIEPLTFTVASEDGTSFMVHYPNLFIPTEISLRLPSMLQGIKDRLREGEEIDGIFVHDEGFYYLVKEAQDGKN